MIRNQQISGSSPLAGSIKRRVFGCLLTPGVLWLPHGYHLGMIRPKKIQRLGVGAVVPHGPNEAARDCLLAAITKRFPGMVDELATIAEGALDERQARLDKWIINWRCSDPWLAQVARDTEESWRRDAILRRHRHWQHEVSWWGVGVEMPPPRFDPISDTVESYLDRARGYAVTVLAQAKESGLVDTPIKRAPEHFEWLACFHFGRWTVERIADEFGGKRGLEDRPVSLAITDAAARCGHCQVEASSRF